MQPPIPHALSRKRHSSYLVALCLVVTAAGCSHGATGLGRHVTSSAGDADFDEDDAAATVAKSHAAPGAPPTPTETASPKDRADAIKAVDRGLTAYHRGEYERAEAALKEALVLNPFLATAHLTLGKIYLLRGVAADDGRRLQKGRRMVEMAVRLDPKSVEARDFLSLFP